MAQQFLDYAGLEAFWSKIKGFMVTNYVARVDGKDLSTNDYTTAEKDKLAGIASGAQVNVIEAVKLGGTELMVSSKAVNIPVESALSTSTNPIQTAVVNTAINTLAAEVDAKVDAASGDAYYTLTKSGTSITGAATTTLTDAVTKANSALQKSDITTGTSNGTISVGGSDVEVQGLGSAAYTESGAYAPASLSEQVGINTSDIATLKGSVSGGVHFIGVKPELPETAINGDVVIVGEKEYVYSKPEGSEGTWVELGDTTAEAQRIKAIEDSYISAFGGKNGVITLDTTASSGNVKFDMSDNMLTGTVNIGVTSFGGVDGDITVNTAESSLSMADGDGTSTVKFEMSGKNLTGSVKIPQGGDLVEVVDSDTIDLSATTTNGKLSISGSVKTDGLNDYVDGRITSKINTLTVAAPTPGEDNVTNVVTGVTQTAGKISPVYTSFSAIPVSLITALA